MLAVVARSRPQAARRSTPLAFRNAQVTLRHERTLDTVSKVSPRSASRSATKTTGSSEP